MRLADYLEHHDVSVADLAAELGVSVQAVYRYKDGSRMPRPRIMRQIEELTEGLVGIADWYAVAGA